MKGVAPATKVTSKFDVNGYISARAILKLQEIGRKRPRVYQNHLSSTSYVSRNYSPMNARVCYSTELKYVSPFYILVSPNHRKYAKNRIKNEQTLGQEQRFEGFSNPV